MATRRSTIPAFPASTSATSTGSGRRHELVPVRHDVPGVERARLQPRIAQHPLRLRPAADGDWPASGERPARALQLHRRHQRLLGRRLHARAAAHGDPPDGSDPGSRRRVAQRVLRQRYLAGDAKPDLEHRPALRGHHARPDIRGPGVDACGEPGNDYPEHVPQPGLRVHRGELRLRPPSWRHVSDRREDRRARRLRDLLQPESDELVHVPDQQPAVGCRDHLHVGSGKPDAVVLEPDRSRGPGGPARHDLADAGAAQRPQGSVELRRAARARARHGAGLPVRRLEHQPPRSQFLQQHADARSWRDRSAAAEPDLPQPAHHPERPGRRLRRAQHHPAQADESGHPVRRPLHVFAHARHGHALERRRRDDGQLRHLARLRSGELGYPAPVRRELPLRRAVSQGLVATCS